MKNLEQFGSSPIIPNEESEQRQQEEEKIPEKHSDKKTPWRLRNGLKLLLKMSVGTPEVHGAENIDKIPADKKVIVATTHILDTDVPAAASVFAEKFDIAIASDSTHFKFSENTAPFIGESLAGRKNFFPVEYKKQEDGPNRTVFNPENFASMEKAMDDGKTVVIAAHSWTDKKEMIRGGYGAVYLASLAENSVIVPTAVVNNQVMVGEPLELPKIEGIEDMQTLMDKRSAGERLTGEELEKFKSLTQALREQSEILMKILAEMVPEEKRGPYKTEAVAA